MAPATCRNRNARVIRISDHEDNAHDKLDHESGTVGARGGALCRRDCGGHVGAGCGRHRATEWHAEEDQYDQDDHHRLPRCIGAVFVLERSARADRLLHRYLPADRRGCPRRARRHRPGEVCGRRYPDPHPEGRRRYGRPGVRHDHQQRRAAQAGGLLANHLRQRNQAAGQANIEAKVVPRHERPHGRGDPGEHQRGGDQGAERQGRSEHRDPGRPRQHPGVRGGRHGQGRRLGRRRRGPLRHRGGVEESS